MKHNKIRVFKDIKNNRWTIYDLKTNKHLGYKKRLCLTNCKLIVIEEKRQKVLTTKKRFPHAWIVGTLTKSDKKGTRQISYNPFLNNQFMNGLRKIKSAKIIILNSEGKVFI